MLRSLFVIAIAAVAAIAHAEPAATRYRIGSLRLTIELPTNEPVIRSLVKGSWTVAYRVGNDAAVVSIHQGPQDEGTVYKTVAAAHKGIAADADHAHVDVAFDPDRTQGDMWIVTAHFNPGSDKPQHILMLGSPLLGGVNCALSSFAAADIALAEKLCLTLAPLR